jgi:DNA repair exonuclease SbcCD ATPase subunit
MLRLKSLKFKNFARFVEPQEISFDKLGNLVQVDAQNNVTGGSSGSGKSSIFNALDWLLGLSDLSTSVLQSRLTKESLSVEGQFDWDGKEVIIHRARKLSVTIDGVETVGSAKLAEEEIDKILGMPRHLFRQMLHRRQGESGFFLAQTPAQMNSFLTDCLNLAPIRSKIDAIDQKLKDLAQAKEKAKTDLQASQAALEATVASQVFLGEEPTTSVTDTLVEGYKAQLSDLESTLLILQAQNKTEKDTLQAQKPKLTVVPYDKTQLEALEAEIKSLEVQISNELDKEHARQTKVNADISAHKSQTNSKISALKLEHGNKIAESKTTMFNLSNMVNTGKTAKEKAVQLAAQLKTLRDGSCHTCLQPWQTEQTKIEEEKILRELSECKTDIEASMVASKEIEELKVALVALNEQMNKDISFLNTSTDAYAAHLAEQTKPQQSPEFLILKEKTLNLSKQKTAEYLKEDAHKTEQNQKNQKLLEVFFVEQKTLTDKHQKALDSVNKEISEAKSVYEQNAQALASHLIALNRFQTSMESLQNKENVDLAKVDEAKEKVKELTEKLEIAEEAKRCLKSYLSCSFDDALDSVSETSTKILRSVPTMTNATVRLVGQKESANGSIKEQVNAILDNDGELEVPIKSLSGGERSAVDLAIDLAVCEMIQEKANRGIDTLVLDEPFGGFDSIGIEQALEMLKTLDKRILIVEHNNIAKEMISEKLTVVRDGETSHIQ